MGFCPTCENFLLTLKTFVETCKENQSVIKERLTVKHQEKFVLSSNVTKLEEADEAKPVKMELFELGLEDQTNENSSRLKPEYIPRLIEVTDLCTICSIKVEDWNDHIKERHVKFIAGKDVVGCTECPYVTSNIHRLKKHFPQHIRLLTPVQCKGCSRNKFETFLIFKNHWYKEHVRPNFECDECGRVFKARHYFKNHFFINHRPSEPYCKHCYKIFSDSEEFETHKRQIGKKKFKEYVCHICGKNVTKSLKEHLKYSQ